MSPAGRPAKPIEEKRRLGNPGHRPLPTEGTLVPLEPIDSIPEPPRPLLQAGTELWERVWSAGATWISPHIDIELLLITCEMVDERWNLRIKVMQSNNMQMARRLDNLTRLIVSNLSLLGFTPSDRSRLGVAEVRAKSALEELMERRANRD